MYRPARRGLFYIWYDIRIYHPRLSIIKIRKNRITSKYHFEIYCVTNCLIWHAAAAYFEFRPLNFETNFLFSFNNWIRVLSLSFICHQIILPSAGWPLCCYLFTELSWQKKSFSKKGVSGITNITSTANTSTTRQKKAGLKPIPFPSGQSICIKKDWKEITRQRNTISGVTCWDLFHWESYCRWPFLFSGDGGSCCRQVYW